MQSTCPVQTFASPKVWLPLALHFLKTNVSFQLVLDSAGHSYLFFFVLKPDYRCTNANYSSLAHDVMQKQESQHTIKGFKKQQKLSTPVSTPLSVGVATQ